MKKILTCSLFALALSALLPAKGDLLYFMANSFDWEGPKYNFDYVKVGVAKSDDNGGWVADWGTDSSKVYLSIVDEDGNPLGSYVDANLHDGVYTDAGPSYADLTGYQTDEYAFYIETFGDGTYSSEKYAGKTIWGFSAETVQTYAQLCAANHVYDPTSMDPQDVTPWVVPEPTSGLLLVFGLAGLALKRRRTGLSSRVSHEVRT